MFGDSRDDSIVSPSFANPSYFQSPSIRTVVSAIPEAARGSLERKANGRTPNERRLAGDLAGRDSNKRQLTVSRLTAIKRFWICPRRRASADFPRPPTTGRSPGALSSYPIGNEINRNKNSKFSNEPLEIFMAVRHSRRFEPGLFTMHPIRVSFPRRWNIGAADTSVGGGKGRGGCSLNRASSARSLLVVCPVRFVNSRREFSIAPHRSGYIFQFSPSFRPGVPFPSSFYLLPLIPYPLFCLRQTTDRFPARV